MKTLTIQIGNSDDKLSQQDWSRYVVELGDMIKNYSDVIHFSGGSSNWEEWQNYCWVIIISNSAFDFFLDNVLLIREMFGQDSVAVTDGNTAFI